MENKKDAARINKSFLKNMSLMLPRINDPGNVSRYKTKKPNNLALKYVINKNANKTSNSVKQKYQTKQDVEMTPGYYSNFKMGKLDGGYMLNYKQYYKHPLDYADRQVP